MFDLFPKINYNFGGFTLSLTNIFSSINLELDSPLEIFTKYITPGERPDIISNNLYNKSSLYWSVFLINDIKNPLSDWSKNQISHNAQIETKYGGCEYQFANTSPFVPGNTFNFNVDKTNSYTGVNFDEILEGDLIIYESGVGSYSVQCIGSGGFTSDFSLCTSPQYGQSNIPDNFDDQNSVVQTTCGEYFTACLTSEGRIRVWGNFNTISSDLIKTQNIWKSSSNGYTFIHGTGNDLLAIKTDGSIVCYGGCTAFNTFQVSSGGPYKKIAWATNGICGGVAITTTGATKHFGFTGFQADMGATFSHIACGSNFCSGIKGSNKQVVVWKGNLGITLCTSGITAGGINVSGFTCSNIAAGDNHIVVLNGGNDMGVTSWGDNTYGQCNVFEFANTPTLISAGSKHTAAIYTDKIQFLGSIATYNQTNGCTGDQSNVNVNGKSISGQFNNISSGKEHVCLQKYGTNKKYIGVISSVDSIYKRIFVKSFQFSDSNSISFDDPSGVVVSIWRWSDALNRYLQIKLIQNQLLSIQKYLDSTLYINENDNLLDITSNSNWINMYIPNYLNGNNSNFITVRKQLMNDDFIKKQKINYLTKDKIELLKAQIRSKFLLNSNINIKLSELQ